MPHVNVTGVLSCMSFSPEDPKAHECHEDHMNAIIYLVPVPYDYTVYGVVLEINYLYLYLYVFSRCLGGCI
jgi:hypothetical protein